MEAEKIIMSNSNDLSRDLEVYRAILDLWKQENPIKTTKLQVLLAVNSGLISVVSFTGGFIAKNTALFVAGALVSAVWVFSIGRTSLYQRLWKHKLDVLQHKHREDSRFSILDVSEAKKSQSRFLRILGGVSSGYYLLGAPVVLCLAWIVILIYISAKSA